MARLGAIFNEKTLHMITKLVEEKKQGIRDLIK